MRSDIITWADKPRLLKLASGLLGAVAVVVGVLAFVAGVAVEALCERVEVPRTRGVFFDCALRVTLCVGVSLLCVPDMQFLSWIFKMRL